MKHRRENNRARHPRASAVPSYHRILVKHGLIEKTLSISDAYEVYLGTVRSINNSKPLHINFLHHSSHFVGSPRATCSRSASRSGIGRARDFSIQCSFPLAAFAECKM